MDNTGGEGMATMVPQLRAEMAQLIEEVLNRRLGPANQRQASQESGDLPPPRGNQHVDLKWRPGDIGFFDPDLDESHGKGDCVQVGNHTYWRNVFLFTDAVQDNAQGERQAVVRQNLNTCLRGSALAWYTSELDNLQRVGLRYAENGVEEWVKALVQRFKDAPNVAMRKLNAERYSVADVKNNKNVRSYVTAVMRHARAAELDKPIQQLSQAYNNLDPQLRPFINRPNHATTVREFMDELEAKQDAWRDMYAARSYPAARTYPGPPNRPQRPQTQQCNNQSFFRRPDPTSFRPWAQAGNRPFSSSFNSANQQPDFKANEYKPRGFLTGKPRLQITAAYAKDQNEPRKTPYDTRSSETKPTERPYQSRFRRFRKFDGANLSEDDYYDVPLEEADNHELEADGYQASEELLLEEREDDTEENQENIFPDQDDAHLTTTIAAKEDRIRCRKCQVIFQSRTKLFKHVYANECEENTSSDSQLSQQDAKLPRSEKVEHAVSIKSNSITECAGYTYMKIKAKRFRNDTLQEICVDTGCSRPLVDRTWLEGMPNVKIDKSRSTIVRGVNGEAHLHEMAEFDLFIPGHIAKEPVTGRFRTKAWVKDELEPKLLLGNGFLHPHQAVMRIAESYLAFESIMKNGSPLEVDTSICYKGPRVVRKVKAGSTTIIPPRTTMKVPICSTDLPRERNFIFEPKLKGAHAAIIDHGHFVAVTNTKLTPQTVKRNERLGTLQEFEEDGYFVMDSGVKNLDPDADQRELPPKLSAGITKPSNIEEIITDDGIRVCSSNPIFAKRLTKLVEQFRECWVARDPIKVPKDERMTIPLVEGWQKQKIAAKAYPLGIKDREFLDRTFDELHRQGRMEWVTNPTPFGCPCFVVWRTVNGERKGRVVVDLRALNKVTVPDAYPMPLQSEITDAMRGKKCISVMDGSAFFHQFLVAEPHRDRFTVISQRGQERSKVALMGFKNSCAYVQRFMDRRLYIYRQFVKAFIDDIVIYSDTEDEHLEHLRRVLTLLREIGLSLSAKKSFLGYPSVELLGHRVDGLGMATTEQRIEAIQNIKMPTTLKNLEHYLGLTGWLRPFIPFYAQVSEPLQAKKTRLLAEGRKKGITSKTRKGYTTRTVIDAEPTEREAYQKLQALLTRPRFLYHFNPDKTLFIKLDASKERGFGVMIFHLEKDTDKVELTKLAAHSIQPVAFLSKLLGSAERNYHPTELEVACLVWTCRRMRVLIQSSKKQVVILTDHAATRGITNQTSLITSDANRSNMRLVHASQYLSQYSLDVRYIPGKLNIVPDSLSRIDAKESKDVEEDNELDNVWMSSEALMTPELKLRIVEGYQMERRYRRILEMLPLPRNDTENVAKAGIPFERMNGLIFYIENDGKRRLCIPDSCVETVLEMAHGKSHAGINRMSYELTDFLIHRLTKRLKEYVQHCPACQLNQTSRSKENGELMPIRTPCQAFHTIAMDFIVGLPEVPAVSPWALDLGGESEKLVFDSLLTVSDKFSKKTLLLPGHSTYSAKEWAEILLRMLMLTDWGIPRAIISDRDPKFVSNFWDHLFKSLGTKILMSTAYHPQTDGISERKNQTVEIGLRYHAFNKPGEEWTRIIIPFQATLNNAYSTAIGTSPNELVYGFRPHNTLTLLSPNVHDHPEPPSVIRDLLRQDAESAIAFAATVAKERYDAKHTPLTLDIGDQVFLRLHKGYRLPGNPSRKLSQQRAGPFKVLRRVGKLAYEIELPPRWKIHPVISVAQLSPAPQQEDPFHRPRPGNPEIVEEEGDTEEWKSYEVERVIDQRMTRYGRKNNLEYLVKFKDMGNEHNDWYPIELLGNAMEMVEEYEKRVAGMKKRQEQQRNPAKARTKTNKEQPPPEITTPNETATRTRQVRLPARFRR